MTQVKCKLLTETGTFPGNNEKLEEEINTWLKEAKISKDNFLGLGLSDIFLPTYGRTRTIAIFYSKE